jgi:NAD-dependent dihydropyrimidine dehydrogenase PreA subunit
MVHVIRRLNTVIEKTNIKVFPEKCTACYSCQLRCSLAYTGAFNPEKARLIIAPPHTISFTDECIKNCSLCARYCAYDAIVRVKGR